MITSCYSILPETFANLLEKSGGKAGEIVRNWRGMEGWATHSIGGQCLVFLQFDCALIALRVF